MQTNWEQFCLLLAGSYFYIWFVFHASLPNQIKLLLFNIFFFDHTLKSGYDTGEKIVKLPRGSPKEEYIKE